MTDVGVGIRTAREIAARIQSAWDGFACSVESFPDIVVEETRDVDFSVFGRLDNLLRLLDDDDVRCLQQPSTFSDLYFKLYDNGRFWIEVLNWYPSDISIHDHNFSGVQFQLKGQSLNVVYDFEGDEVAPGVHVGATTVRSAQIWLEGSHSYVRPGAIDPHNVSHLSVPTVSLLIRTHPSIKFGPQLNYLPPYVAASYDVADPAFRKKLTGLRLLAAHDEKSFAKSLQRVFEDATEREALFVILKLVDVLFTPRYAPLLHEFAESGRPVVGATIKGAAVLRAHAFLSNTIKQNTSFSKSEYLVLSLLTTVFDRHSFDSAAGQIAASLPTASLDSMLNRIRAKVSGPTHEMLRSIVQLYELGDACDVPLGTDGINGEYPVRQIPENLGPHAHQR